jgi:hypothetical protein
MMDHNIQGRADTSTLRWKNMELVRSKREEKKKKRRELARRLLISGGQKDSERLIIKDSNITAVRHCDRGPGNEGGCPVPCFSG